ncbi:MAG: glycoside-pentoside-hexuronide (GPH):cation symporter [Cellulosilyticum sp.]|nr:glycoside-pentoside-hexuronide (GPH):cation symporter [Cellulosilyticum sp.]
MENKNVKPFGFKDKFSYMLGNVGCDLMFLLSSMYLLKFYTDVMGVSAAIVGSMMMISRFVDAFTDVTMGQIVDRAPTKAKGKFAPFIRMVAGPVALASFLMYASWFKDMGMTFKVIWMFATYLLWGSVFYTGINIPYGSMASAITDSPRERAELSKWRTLGTQFVVVLTSVVLPTFIYYTNDAGQSALSGTNMMIAAGVFSVVAFIAFMVCYHMTTERVKFEAKTEKFSLAALIKSFVTNKALIGLVLLSLVSLLGQMSYSNMQGYIYPNYFGNPGGISMTNLLGIVITLGVSVFIVPLSDKFGRKNLAIFAAGIQAASFMVLYFIHTDNLWVWTAIFEIGFIGSGIFSLITWAMLADVIDDTEVVTGERADGTVYSIYSFSRKCGQGFSSGIAGAMLSMVGYTAATAFDPEVVKSIYDVTCLVPGISFIVLVLVIIFFYPLGKKRVDANTAELRRRRAAK